MHVKWNELFLQCLSQMREQKLQEKRKEEKEEKKAHSNLLSLVSLSSFLFFLFLESWVVCLCCNTHSHNSLVLCVHLAHATCIAKGTGATVTVASVASRQTQIIEEKKEKEYRVRIRWNGHHRGWSEKKRSTRRKNKDTHTEPKRKWSTPVVV